jgi:hypothetical protein
VQASTTLALASLASGLAPVAMVACHPRWIRGSSVLVPRRHRRRPRHAVSKPRHHPLETSGCPGSSCSRRLHRCHSCCSSAVAAPLAAAAVPCICATSASGGRPLPRPRRPQGKESPPPWGTPAPSVPACCASSSCCRRLGDSAGNLPPSQRRRSHMSMAGPSRCIRMIAPPPALTLT